jgi:hypothetical protein
VGTQIIARALFSVIVHNKGKSVKHFLGTFFVRVDSFVRNVSQAPIPEVKSYLPGTPIFGDSADRVEHAALQLQLRAISRD